MILLKYLQSYGVIGIKDNTRTSTVHVTPTLSVPVLSSKRSAVIILATLRLRGLQLQQQNFCGLHNMATILVACVRGQLLVRYVSATDIPRLLNWRFAILPYSCFLMTLEWKQFTDLLGAKTGGQPHYREQT